MACAVSSSSFSQEYAKILQVLSYKHIVNENLGTSNRHDHDSNPSYKVSKFVLENGKLN